ncbi:hypothetical protein JCM14722_28160 [Pseudodesulfovibrio portus]|uniref:Secreted protein n=1 Tax=Pseudodesulfovibrio portus TaxID=231439 RepID=A0ABM8AUX6_9BACT|nr:hypothetical protein JCM14722_28160 [Pseudodesulfovibrio portus]
MSATLRLWAATLSSMSNLSQNALHWPSSGTGRAGSKAIPGGEGSGERAENCALGFFAVMAWRSRWAAQGRGWSAASLRPTGLTYQSGGEK